MTRGIALVIGTFIAALLASAACAQTEQKPDPEAERRQARVQVPAPVIRIASVSRSVIGSGREATVWFDYDIEVINRDALPNWLFETTSALEACGATASSSRSWVTLYYENSETAYAYCQLDRAALRHVRLPRRISIGPKPRFYLEIWDRKLNRRYKSNLLQIP